MSKDSWNRCTDILLHFNQPELCWNMKTAVDLFYIFNEKNFSTDVELKKIKLKYSDFIYFKDAEINLKSRAVKMEMENSLENTMDLLFYYQELRDVVFKEKGSKSIACGSDLIIGIYKYYVKILDSRNEPNNNVLKNLSVEHEKELANLYDDMCFEYDDNTFRRSWPLYKLEAVANGAKFINFNKFKMFIKKGYKIPDAGWYTKDKPESQWPVEFVLSKIMPKGNEGIDEYAITAISEAIKFGFSSETYIEYVNLFSVHAWSNLNWYNCQNEVISALMRKTKEHGTTDTGHWLKIQNKKIFNYHLKLLIELYNKTKKEDGGCDNFINIFSYIESVYCDFKSKEEHMNSLIKGALDSGMTLKEFFACLNFSRNVYFWTSDLLNPTKYASKRDKHGNWIRVPTLRKEWTPTYSQINEFRVKLFSNGKKGAELCASETATSRIIQASSLTQIYKDVLDWNLPSNSK